MMKNNRNTYIIIVVAFILVMATFLYYHDQQKSLEQNVSRLALRQNSYYRPIQTELVISTKSSCEHAIELTNHIGNIVKNHAYKELAEVRFKEKAIQTLFNTTAINQPYLLVPESNYGRGPCDFLVIAKNERTLIEIKLVRNTSFKKVENQLGVYFDASGITNAVLALTAFNEKELAKAEKWKGKLAHRTNIETIIFDSTLDKLSGSRGIA